MNRKTPMVRNGLKPFPTAFSRRWRLKNRDLADLFEEMAGAGVKGREKKTKGYLNKEENPLWIKSINDGTSGKGAGVKDKTNIRKAIPPNNVLVVPRGV